jgi:hypothetical protein
MVRGSRSKRPRPESLHEVPRRFALFAPGRNNTIRVGTVVRTCRPGNEPRHRRPASMKSRPMPAHPGARAQGPARARIPVDQVEQPAISYDAAIYHEAETDSFQNEIIAKEISGTSHFRRVPELPARAGDFEALTASIPISGPEAWCKAEDQLGALQPSEPLGCDQDDFFMVRRKTGIVPVKRPSNSVCADV